MKKHYLIGGLALVLIIGATIFWPKDNIPKDQDEEQNIGLVFRSYASDVVGTKVGTTTTGVQFTDNAATTTYVSKIGGLINTAVYTFGIKAASSTAAGESNLKMSILASNDDHCDTATSTTIEDLVATGEVNWYDAAPFLLNGASEQSLTNGTSTISWITSGLGPGNGREVLLTDLNAECLALQLNGSSTRVWAQIRTK